jgi:hypothetical protein
MAITPEKVVCFPSGKKSPALLRMVKLLFFLDLTTERSVGCSVELNNNCRCLSKDFFSFAVRINKLLKIGEIAGDGVAPGKLDVPPGDFALAGLKNIDKLLLVDNHKNAIERLVGFSGWSALP